MYEILTMTFVLLAGACLGVFFFGGLWWTVQRGVTSDHPALLFLGSLLIRTSLVLSGFYYVSLVHWSRLVVCLLGFVIARSIVVRRYAPAQLNGMSLLGNGDENASGS